MTASNIREKLQDYIEHGDEKLLKLMYVMAREYNNDDDFEYQFTENEIKIFEERRTKRLNGDSKTYNWDEAKELITGKRNKK
jgi:hypothetical protein